MHHMLILQYDQCAEKPRQRAARQRAVRRCARVPPHGSAHQQQPGRQRRGVHQSCEVTFDAKEEHTQDGRGAQAGAHIRIQAPQRRQKVALRRGEDHVQGRRGDAPEEHFALMFVLGLAAQSHGRTSEPPTSRTEHLKTRRCSQPLP